MKDVPDWDNSSITDKKFSATEACQKSARFLDLVYIVGSFFAF